MTFSPKTILKIDGYLEPFIPAITSRYALFQHWKDKIQSSEGGLDKFAKGYNKFGFNVHENGEIVYREWAPNASEAVLIGEFSLTFPNSSTRLLSESLFQTIGIESPILWFVIIMVFGRLSFLQNQMVNPLFLMIPKSRSLSSTPDKTCAKLIHNLDFNDSSRWRAHRKASSLDQTCYPGSQSVPRI